VTEPTEPSEALLETAPETTEEGSDPDFSEARELEVTPEGYDMATSVPSAPDSADTAPPESTAEAVPDAADSPPVEPAHDTAAAPPVEAVSEPLPEKTAEMTPDSATVPPLTPEETVAPSEMAVAAAPDLMDVVAVEETPDAIAIDSVETPDFGETSPNSVETATVTPPVDIVSAVSPSVSTTPPPEPVVPVESEPIAETVTEVVPEITPSPVSEPTTVETTEVTPSPLAPVTLASAEPLTSSPDTSSMAEPVSPEDTVLAEVDTSSENAVPVSMRPPSRPVGLSTSTSEPPASVGSVGNSNTNAVQGSTDGSAEALDSFGGTGTNLTPSTLDSTQATQYGNFVLEKITETEKERTRIRGAALIAFTISETGYLISVSVAQSSGSEELDEIGMNHIRRAAPFPPPPVGARRSFTIQFTGR